ncbi:SRPBCC family protein [Hirschia baltica]|uniref:Activator of Hsp90 ATPase 1 family protein n=1 Tax=Hirschia baltica (strain ATCC 49814 / DSM 5838 / IFAM 1418) TaxID=582402 RepID=C6XKX8_HIRBI|nr:SRPBCC domain-containing protein [Hirschia baltica]ACT57807.1 Activator of Hsp90 ATPase 1 family protein [Hirschia baltica ATCC 49814]
MTELSLTKTIILKAPPQHVWKFLTQTDLLATWFHNAGSDLVEGGEYKIVSNSIGKEGDAIIWGEVLLSDAPNKLVHTFTHPMLQEKNTVCTWTLTEIEGGTLLTLVHTGFELVEDASFSMAQAHDKGWDEHFLRLRHVVS